MRYAPRLHRQENGRGFCDREGTKSLSVFRERRQVYKPSSLVLRPPQGWDKVSHSNRPFPKSKRGGQAPLGLARLDYLEAKPGGAVNGGARSAPFISTIDGHGWVCYPAAATAPTRPCGPPTTPGTPGLSERGWVKSVITQHQLSFRF